MLLPTLTVKKPPCHANTALQQHAGVQTIISASKISSSFPPEGSHETFEGLKKSLLTSYSVTAAALGRRPTLPLHLTNWYAAAESKQKNLDVGHGSWFLRAPDKWLPTGTHLEAFLTTSTSLRFCFCSTISEHVQVRGGNNTDRGTQLTTGPSSVVIRTFWVNRMVQKGQTGFILL